jgi:hypothetical protein
LSVLCHFDVKKDAPAKSRGIFYLIPANSAVSSGRGFVSRLQLRDQAIFELTMVVFEETSTRLVSGRFKASNLR